MKATDLKRWEEACKYLQEQGYELTQGQIRLGISNGEITAKMLCVDKDNNVHNISVVQFLEPEEKPDPRQHWIDQGYIVLDCN